MSIVGQLLPHLPQTTPNVAPILIRSTVQQLSSSSQTNRNKYLAIFHFSFVFFFFLNSGGFSVLMYTIFFLFLK